MTATLNAANQKKFLCWKTDTWETAIFYTQDAAAAAYADDPLPNDGKTTLKGRRPPKPSNSVVLQQVASASAPWGKKGEFLLVPFKSLGFSFTKLFEQAVLPSTTKGRCVVIKSVKADAAKPGFFEGTFVGIVDFANVKVEEVVVEQISLKWQ
jgi:hypothetical protein